MSELAAPVVFYPQVLKNVRVKSKPDAQNDPEVQKAVAAVAEIGPGFGVVPFAQHGPQAAQQNRHRKQQENALAGGQRI